jgi:hypothetical protein
VRSFDQEPPEAAMSEPLTAHAFIEQLVARAGTETRSRADSSFRHDEPDQFIAVPMRDVFTLAKAFIDLPLHEIETLLEDPVHEIRVGAVSIMDFQARRRRTPTEQRAALYELYLRRHDRINNWDLVDRAAPSVIGDWLADKPREPLYRLARSKNVWERRTAIVATYAFLKRHELDDTFGIAELLLADRHDLIQKAVGGWIREAGKQAPARLHAFLDQHAHQMGSIALGYAVERLDPAARTHYRQLGRRTNT